MTHPLALFLFHPISPSEDISLLGTRYRILANSVSCPQNITRALARGNLLDDHMRLLRSFHSLAMTGSKLCKGLIYNRTDSKWRAINAILLQMGIDLPRSLPELEAITELRYGLEGKILKIYETVRGSSIRQAHDHNERGYPFPRETV